MYKIIVKNLDEKYPGEEVYTQLIDDLNIKSLVTFLNKKSDYTVTQDAPPEAKANTDEEEEEKPGGGRNKSSKT